MPARGRNDYQAILAWLRSKHGLSPDQKAHLHDSEEPVGLPGRSELLVGPTLVSGQRSAVSVPRTAGPKVNAGRSFSLAQWDFIGGPLAMLTPTSASQRLVFGLHQLYATGLRLSAVVAATVDDLTWVEYPAAASDDQPQPGWMLRVAGKGQKAREVPLPADVVGELARDLKGRGLDADPEGIGNLGWFLPGKAGDAAERAPGLGAGQLYDPRQDIAATAF